MSTLIFILLCGILLLFLLSFFLPIDADRPSHHGSARFSHRSSLRAGNTGWVIDGDQLALPRNSSFQHLLLLAPTGFGKSTKFCLPQLLSLDDCSFIVTDPKGELYRLCAERLRQKGYQVLVFDADRPAYSCHFNPLLRLPDDAAIQQFANAVIAIENKSVEVQAIWSLGPARIIQALISCLKNVEDQGYCNLSVLSQLLTGMSTELVRLFVLRYGDVETKEWFADFMAMPPRTRDSQVMSAQAALVRFQTKQMRLLTADDTIDFESLRKQKTALFLKLPAGDPARLGPIVSLFYAQLFRHILETPLERSDLDLLVLLEEFGNLSIIPNFDSAVTLLRSQRCGLAMICQDLQMIYSLYKTRANTIISNASSILAYPGIKDPATLRYLTQLLGRATVEIKQQGRNSKYMGRQLLMEDEIRTMEHYEGLFVHGNHYAEKIITTPIYKNTRLLRAAGLRSIDGRLVPQEPEEQVPVPLAEGYLRFPLKQKLLIDPRNQVLLDDVFDDE